MEKTKKHFDYLISRMSETKTKIGELQKEKSEIVREMSAIDARLHNDRLAEDIASSSTKRACTKENWEAMFDDMFELCSFIERAKLPYAQKDKWGYVYSGYCVEGSVPPYKNAQPGDAILLDFVLLGSSIYSVQKKTLVAPLHVNGESIGAIISKDLPYQVTPIGVVTAAFCYDAFTTHLVENWEVIYASAVKYVEELMQEHEGLMLTQEAELVNELRLLAGQMREHREARKERCTEKEDMEGR